MPEYQGDITLSCSVTNLDTAIAWFEEMLGFERLFRVDEEGWAEVGSPARDVSIGLGVNETVDGRGGTTPVFGVADVVAARAELEAKGVRFDGDIVEVPGMVKLATFFDPDGNKHMLYQDLQGDAS